MKHKGAIINAVIRSIKAKKFGIAELIKKHKITFPNVIPNQIAVPRIPRSLTISSSY